MRQIGNRCYLHHRASSSPFERVGAGRWSLCPVSPFYPGRSVRQIGNRCYLHHRASPSPFERVGVGPWSLFPVSPFYPGRSVLQVGNRCYLHHRDSSLSLWERVGVRGKLIDPVFQGIHQLVIAAAQGQLLAVERDFCTVSQQCAYGLIPLVTLRIRAHHAGRSEVFHRQHAVF